MNLRHTKNGAIFGSRPVQTVYICTVQFYATQHKKNKQKQINKHIGPIMQNS